MINVYLIKILTFCLEVWKNDFKVDLGKRCVELINKFLENKYE